MSAQPGLHELMIEGVPAGQYKHVPEHFSKNVHEQCKTGERREQLELEPSLWPLPGVLLKLSILPLVNVTFSR
jgi:hypothetical protein